MLIDDIIQQKLKDIRYRVQQYGLLLCSNENTFAFVKHKLELMNLRLDSNIFVSLKFGTSYYVYEFYNPGYQNGSKLNLYNSINYTEGRILTNSMSIYEMRKNLSSLHLNVAFVVSIILLIPSLSRYLAVILHKGHSFLFGSYVTRS